MCLFKVSTLGTCLDTSCRQISHPCVCVWWWKFLAKTNVYGHRVHLCLFSLACIELWLSGFLYLDTPAGTRGTTAWLHPRSECGGLAAVCWGKSRKRNTGRSSTASHSLVWRQARRIRLHPAGRTWCQPTCAWPNGVGRRCLGRLHFGESHCHLKAMLWLLVMSKILQRVPAWPLPQCWAHFVRHFVYQSAALVARTSWRPDLAQTERWSAKRRRWHPLNVRSVGNTRTACWRPRRWARAWVSRWAIPCTEGRPPCKRTVAETGRSVRTR